MSEGLAKYLKSYYAFFQMSFKDKDGFVWVEAEDKESLLEFASENLVINQVNKAYMNMYKYPSEKSPLGMNMVELVGCKKAAIFLIQSKKRFFVFLSGLCVLRG